MKATAPYAVIGLGIILMATIAWWFGFKEKEPNTEKPNAIPPITVSEGLSIYTSGEHGFLLSYPDGAEVTESFESSRLPEAWRINALPEASGMPLLSVATYRTESAIAYPRFYETVVRLGKSIDPKEVAECEKPRVSAGEEALSDRVIGERAWKAFSFGDAAMMKYIKGVSYRTEKDGACYALEAIAVGSSYREEPSADDLADEQLLTEYQKLDTIIDSFRFVR